MRHPAFETLEPRNLCALDVNHDGLISPADVAMVVNSINAQEARYVPLDALAIINDLNLNGPRPVLAVTILAVNERPKVGQQQIAVARIAAVEPADVHQITLRLDQHGIGIDTFGKWTMNGKAADLFQRSTDGVAEFRWGGTYPWMPPVMRVDAAVDLVFSGAISDDAGWLGVEVGVI